MKGQYLALETVLTFGLGLIAAVGIISIFDSYSSGIYDTSEQVEARIVSEKVLNNINAVRSVDGEIYREIELPEDISNREYEIVLDDRLIVDVSGKEYKFDLPANQNFEGKGSGEITIYRNATIIEMVDA